MARVSLSWALILGLLEGGMEVLDVGLALSPMAYFGQFELDAPCVAMVKGDSFCNQLWKCCHIHLLPF